MQLVLRHCCKTAWIAMLRVLPPTNKTCLATNQVVNRFEQGWQNGQHRFSTRLVAMLQNKLHVFVARFTEALVIFVVIYPGCRSGAWRWRARPGTSGARTSERWKSAGGGRRNAAGNTRKRTTAGTGKLTERFRIFEINSKLPSCMFMLFHFNFLFGDLNTYEHILKDYPLCTKNTSFSLPRSSLTRDYAGI